MAQAQSFVPVVFFWETSGLGNKSPGCAISLVNRIFQMQDRIAIFCCNLKPAKMRGIMSEGMIMCGSSPEKVEIIQPPSGSTKGERVVVDGYPGIYLKRLKQTNYDCSRS